MLSDQVGGVRLPAGLRPAAAADLDHVLDLLISVGLPTAGVGEVFDRFVVATRNELVVGVAGLEVAETSGLLRSVAVAESERGRGTGLALIARIIADARQLDLDDIWLLTETAAPLFSRLGFRVRSRQEAPAGIAATGEFRTCCPESAAVMSRRVRPIRVLVLCTANSARSQIAEALLHHRLGDRVVAASAGTAPSGEVHPLAVAVLAERGISWEGRRSKGMDEVGGRWDLAITVCDGARESCPVVPAPRHLHWGMPDPAGAGIEQFRDVADRLERLIDSLD
jgi:protein-tyrosine-phosphatase/N-acetylglutamate synthase-like GNAT family acetyltransferase